MPEVICHKDEGSDVTIPYEKRDDDVWYATFPDGRVGFIDGTVTARTVEQLIRKEYDDNY